MEFHPPTLKRHFQLTPGWNDVGAGGGCGATKLVVGSPGAINLRFYDIPLPSSLPPSSPSPSFSSHEFLHKIFHVTLPPPRPPPRLFNLCFFFCCPVPSLLSLPLSLLELSCNAALNPQTTTMTVSAGVVSLPLSPHLLRLVYDLGRHELHPRSRN